MEQQPKRVVILGGGITGLSAAFYVQKLFSEQQVPVSITIIEQNAVFGGKISTLHKEGYVIEKGPDSFLARKMPIIDLTRELGLEDQLVATNPQAKKTYILYKSRLHRMPQGLVLGIPTQLTPFLKTNLLSLPGKLRAGFDLLLPRRKGTGDESLGGFLQRRLGQEVVERIAEPLLAGIYAGDTFKLSLQATFPQFQAAEQKHGSLIRGMLANKKNTPPAVNAPEIAKNSMFLSYRKGLQTLIDGLLAALEKAKLVPNKTVTGVNKRGNCYEVTFTNGEPLIADAVIAALPNFATARLFTQLPAVHALGNMPYVSVANVIMTYDQDTLGHALDGSGFVVPRKEGRFITACTWTSAKWRHTSPKGKALIRCYVGRSGEEGWIALSDAEIVKRVRTDLQQLMGIRAEPLFSEVTRLTHSMPQYPVDHLHIVKEARQALSAALPHVFLAGAGYHGVGLPDCIQQGKEAAGHVLHALTAASSS